MANNEGHVYPPVSQESRMEEDPQSVELQAYSTVTSPPQAAGIKEDPRFVAFVQDLVRQQTRAMEDTFQRELATREEAYRTWQQESDQREAGLRAEIQRLSTQLQPTTEPVLEVTIPQFQVMSSDPPLANGDAVMNDSNTTQVQVELPPDVAAQIPVIESPRQPDTPGTSGQRPPPRRRKPAQRPTVPNSVPARNLRSRTCQQVQGSSAVGAEPIPPSHISLPPAPSAPPPFSQGFQPAAPPASAPTEARAPAVTKEEPKKKRASELYHVLDSELPSDIGGLKDALSLHIRILWRLSDAKQVPGNPQDHILRLFSSHIQTEAALYECQRGPALIPTSLIEFQTTIPPSARGRVQQRMRMVEEHILEYVQTLLSRFGLLRWHPDFRQSAYSLFNSACRIIALDTFKQALVSHAYSSMKPNISYVMDLAFLIKLYDHVVHHYLFSRYKKEARNAGSLQAADKTSPQYRSRTRLAEARAKFLKENHYPQRYIDLIDAKTTSDDEKDPDGRTENGRDIYWIRKRPERSLEANTFIRRLDVIQRQDALIDPTKTWQERLRKVPESSQQISEFTTLPENIPVDYYLPSFFNQLQPRLHNMIADPQIAFLPDVSQSFLGSADEKLNDEDFLDKYGTSVLVRYKLDDLDGFDADEESAEDEEMYEADVSMRRNTLVAHLSEESV